MNDRQEKRARVPLPTIQRLPLYLSCLMSEASRGAKHISSSGIAEKLGLTGIQVRKDLAWITDSGKPRTGFPIFKLIDDIRDYLGYKIEKHAVLVGVGHLGTALLHYDGFRDYGIKIVAAFDTNRRKIGRNINDTPICALEDFEKMHREFAPELVILTVPSSQAQAVTDLIVSAGIKAIWNFAPTLLSVPDDVTVEAIDMAQSLAVLWRQMSGDGNSLL